MDREKDPYFDSPDDERSVPRLHTGHSSASDSVSASRRDVIVLDDCCDGDSDNGHGSDGGPGGVSKKASARVGCAPVGVTLPIEGVLLAPDASHTLLPPSPPPPPCRSPVGGVINTGQEGEEETERGRASLWMPLFGLHILSFPLYAPPSAVNFYSSEDIAALISEHQQQAGSDLPPVKVFWWNRYTQAVSSLPPPRLAPCRGGILADQM
jgi:hypothetical protein